MRNSVFVFIAPVNGKTCLHFCSTKLQGKNIWFPLNQGHYENGATGTELIQLVRKYHEEKDVSLAIDSFFAEIEWLLVAHGVAHNVTRLEFVRPCGDAGIELNVVYNERG